MICWKVPSFVTEIQGSRFETAGQNSLLALHVHESGQPTVHPRKHVYARTYRPFAWLSLCCTYSVLRFIRPPEKPGGHLAYLGGRVKGGLA